MADIPFVFPKRAGPAPENSAPEAASEKSAERPAAGKPAPERPAPEKPAADRRFDPRSIDLIDRLVGTPWAWLALALFVCALSIPGMISMPVLDRDEGRFTQASAQMLESGDYVVIRYHEGLRNKKPVGIHWMQTAAVFLTSSAEARDIAAFRIPSLLGAILAAWSLFWGGTALFNRRAAFIGAALLGATLLLSSEAHIGKTDAAQCGFLTLMMAALAQLRTQGATLGRRSMSVLFWFAMGVGILLKGVIAPMVGIATILCLFLWERKVEWAKPLTFWFGLSLCAVMVIPWFLAVQVGSGGEFMREAIDVDLAPKMVGAAEGHKGLPGQHLAGLPLLFWPSTLLLVPGVWLAVSRLTQMRRTPAVSRQTGSTIGPAAKAVAEAWAAQEAGAWRFLACWLVPSWLIFEIMPTKLFHYTLPLYPVFALMAGVAADKWLSTNNKMEGRWISIVLFGGTSLLLAAAVSPWALSAIRADAARDFGADLAPRVAWIWSEAWKATGVSFWPSLLILLTAGGTIYAAVKRLPLAMLGGILACSLVGGVALRTAVLPNQSWMLATDAAMSALKDVCAFPEDTAAWKKSGCEGRAPKIVRAISFAEPSFVFEMGGKVTLPPVSKAVIPPVADDNRPAWLINAFDEDGRKALDQLTEAAAAADRCIRFSRRFVYNYSNGDPSILVAAVVEPAGCVTEPPPEDLRKSQPDEAPELEQ